MTLDFRALCAKLVSAWDSYSYSYADAGDATDRMTQYITEALAALAQPEPVAPTDEELTLVYAYAVAAAVDNKRGPFKPEDAEAAQLAGLRAVLTRWGTPNPITEELK
jgi:hypothetical protein